MKQIPSEDPQTLYTAAVAQQNAGNPSGAYETFIHLWKTYPRHELAPRALYSAASIKASTDTGTAAELYLSFIESYPQSDLLPTVRQELLGHYLRQGTYTEAAALFKEIYAVNRDLGMVSPGIELATGLAETEHLYPALEIVALTYPLSSGESRDTLKGLWTSTLEEIDEVDLLVQLEKSTQEGELFDALLARQAKLYLEQDDKDLAQKIMDLLQGRPGQELIGKTTIGVVVPLSGKWEAVGQKVLKGVAFASKVFSKDKAPNVQYIIRDYGNDESAIPGIIDELDRKHNVISIIGPIGETAGAIACREAQARGIPSFMFTRGDIVSSEKSFCFRNFVSVDIQVKTLLQAAVDMNITRFAILHPGDHFGNVFTSLFIQYAPDYNIEIVRQVGYSPQLVDFKEAVNKLIEDIPQPAPKETQEQTGDNAVTKIEPDFDALLIPDTAINAAMIASYLPYFSIEGVRLFGPTLWDTPDFLRVGGKYVDEAVFVSGFFISSQLDFVQDFNNEFYYTFGYSPSVWEASAYDSATVVQNLLEGALHTRETLRDQISSVKDYPGLTGATSFYPDGSVDKSIYVLTVKGSTIYEIVP